MLYTELITSTALKVQPKSMNIFHGIMSYCFCGVRTLCPIDLRGSGQFVISLLFSVRITAFQVNLRPKCVGLG